MNVKTPFGYVVCFLAQAAAYVINCGTSFGAIALTIGSCGIMVTLCQSIARKFKIFDENYKMNENRLEKHIATMKLELCDAIRLHTEAKQLRTINDIFWYQKRT